MGQNTDAQSAEEQNWMIRIWNSGIVQNVMAIMNIARIICSHIHMLNNQERNRRNMKKTKIICTMGPNTNDETMMRKLVQNGMDIARFNFSHGDHEEKFLPFASIRINYPSFIEFVIF